MQPKQLCITAWYFITVTVSSLHGIRATEISSTFKALENIEIQKSDFYSTGIGELELHIYFKKELAVSVKNFRYSMTTGINSSYSKDNDFNIIS